MRPPEVAALPTGNCPQRDAAGAAQSFVQALRLDPSFVDAKRELEAALAHMRSQMATVEAAPAEKAAAVAAADKAWDRAQSIRSLVSTYASIARCSYFAILVSESGWERNRVLAHFNLSVLHCERGAPGTAPQRR